MWCIWRLCSLKRISLRGMEFMVPHTPSDTTRSDLQLFISLYFVTKYFGIIWQNKIRAFDNIHNEFHIYFLIISRKYLSKKEYVLYRINHTKSKIIAKNDLSLYHQESVPKIQMLLFSRIKSPYFYSVKSIFCLFIWNDTIQPLYANKYLCYFNFERYTLILALYQRINTAIFGEHQELLRWLLTIANRKSN